MKSALVLRATRRRHQGVSVGVNRNVLAAIGLLTVAAWPHVTFAGEVRRLEPSPYTRYGVPPEPGQPFRIEGQIAGGIPETERQIPPAAGSGIDPNHVFTPAELIDEALRRNPTTRQSWETANAQAATLAAARGAYWPTATFTSAAKPAYGRADRFNQSAAAGETRTSAIDYGPSVKVDYLLLDFGGRNAAIDAARFNLLASELAINQTLQTVATNVLKNYYALQQSEESLRFAKDSLEKAKSAIDAVEQCQYEIQPPRPPAPLIETPLSVAPRQENLQYDVLEKQRTLLRPAARIFDLNVEIARAASETARDQLAASVGLPANAQLQVTSPGEPPQIEFVGVDVEQRMVDLALERRPDIANKYAAYRSAKAGARKAESDIYPNVTASLTGSTIETNKRVNVADPTAPSDTHTVGRADDLAGALTVTVPVFDAFGLVNKARAARRTALAAHAELATVELNAISDIGVSFHAYQSAVSQYKNAGNLLDRAECAFETAQQTYEKVQRSFCKHVAPDPDAARRFSEALKKVASASGDTPEAATSFLNAEAQLVSARPLDGSAMDAALDIFLDALRTLDSAKATKSQAKFSVFSTSFQLTNATGALLPVVTAEANQEVPSVLSIPLPSRPSKPLPKATCPPVR